MPLHTCPGCGNHYTEPIPREKPRADLACKHCGMVATGVERKSRVCLGCGICALCGSEHPVFIRNKGTTQ